MVKDNGVNESEWLKTTHFLLKYLEMERLLQHFKLLPILQGNTLSTFTT